MNTFPRNALGLGRVAAWIRNRYSRGVGLIDVLIAMLVLAGGVAGLAKMQAVVLKENDSSKARSVATQLASAKIDDLRSFTQTDAGAAGVFGYDEIGANAGGAEKGDGSLHLPTGNVTVGNVVFTRTWTAEPRYFCGFNAAASGTNCAGADAKPRSDYFAIAVTVAWTDADGTPQSVVLNGTASSSDPLLAVFSLLSIMPEGPIVTYVPGQAPQVIAIDTGGGRKIETTNPTPSLNKRGQTVINTIARYETVSYDASNQTQRRKEFTTINCECRQLGEGTGEDRSGNSVTKRIGEAADQFQAFECDICCRDHHDTSASCDPTTESGRKGCYDPFRDSSGYMASGGDHKHFTAASVPADADGDVYVEACRMERIDGYLRVVPDWKLEVVNTIPENYFTSSSANVTAYGSYVKDFVQSVLSGSAAPAKGWSENETLAKNATQQFLARGIYVDYLTSAEKSEYASRIAANDPQVFQEIPFYEVNLTKLARWAPNPLPPPTVATVTNDPLVAELEGQNLYSRGLATAVNSGTTNIVATVRLGNTGIIDQFVSTDPQETAEYQSPYVVLTVPGTTYQVTGTVSGVGASDTVAVTATGTGGNPNSTCTYVSGGFTCTLPQGWSGTLSASAAGYSISPGTIDITSLAANLGSQTFTATPAQIDYIVSGSISPAVADAGISAIGLAPSADGSCTVTGGGNYTCTLPAGWSGTIQPTSATSGFSPGSQGITGLSGNQTLNFTSIAAASSYTVSGVINYRPTSLVGTLTVVASGGTGASCGTVAGNGAYTCTVPAGWTGTLTPTVDAMLDPGITFVPVGRNVTSVSGNMSNQDFQTHFRISGKVAYRSDQTPIPGVAFAATGNSGSPNGVCAAYNDADGTYACTVPGGWNGDVVPSKSGLDFDPASRPYSNITGPSTNQNYQDAVAPPTIYTLTVLITGLQKSTNSAVTAVTGLTCTDANPKRSGSGTNQTDTIYCTFQSGWSGTVTPTLTPDTGKTCSLATGSPPAASKTFGSLTGDTSVTFTGSGNGC